MSLIGTLRTSVSGMNAQSNRISTVAENIQNASTTGYKSTSVEFSSLILESADYGNYNSGAVESTVRRSVNQQGSVAFTTSKTDLAIQGNGFFVVQDANKAPYLTRAGNFVMDGTSGNVVNAGGFTLLGYKIGADPSLNSVSDMVPVDLQQFGAQAQATENATIAGNLPLAADQTSKKTSLVVFDSLGQQKTIGIAMTKDNAGIWTMAFSDGATPAGSETLAFGSNGKLSTPQSTTVTLASGQEVALDLSGITQLAADYSLTGKTTDGSAAAPVTGAEFGTDGTVYATYADGTRTAAYKVPLANVASPDNLDPRAGNVYKPSVDSGDIQVGFAGLGGLGAIKTGALEQSNVDVSNELTSMIESQSVYNANSKVFMTGNELLDTLMNLKR